MKTTVSTKGQIVLPAEIRQLDQVLPGQQFSVERIESGQYRMALSQLIFPTARADIGLGRRGSLFYDRSGPGWSCGK